MSKPRYYFVGERDDSARWAVLGFSTFERAYSLCELINSQLDDVREFNDWYVVNADGVPVVFRAGELVTCPYWLGTPVELARYV